MDMLATPIQTDGATQWSRALHDNEGSQPELVASARRQEIGKRQQRHREHSTSTAAMSYGGANGISNIEPQGGVSYGEYGSDTVQHQLDMIGSPHTADDQISTGFLDFLSSDSVLFNFDVPSGHNSPRTHLSTQSSDRAGNIPAERFSQVARLWPIRTAENSAHMTRFSLWSEVIEFAGDNICTDPSNSKTSPSLSIGDQDESKWGLDEDKRLLLMQEPMAIGIDNQTGMLDNRPMNSDFPTTRLLNIALDSAFRQPQSVLVFIHRATFSAKTASNSIIFPLCLLGLATLDSRAAKEHTLAYLPMATEQCCTQLAHFQSQAGNSLELITRLISATLLLATWSMIPLNASREETLVQMLHMQVMLRAKNAGLLLPPQTGCLSLSQGLLEKIQGRAQSRSDDVPSDDGLWKAWARVESVKRLVSVLTVMDAWWSHNMSSRPQLSSNYVGLEMPGSTSLFRCTSARTWRRLIDEETKIFNDCALIQHYPLLIQLPGMDDPSPISVVGLLSTVWIRINEICLSMPVYAQPQNHSSVMPQRIVAYEEQGKQLGYILYEIHTKYTSFLQLKNPNCLVLWHFLNLHLFCQVSIFELAAGHSGAESARTALQEIAAWCHKPEARRACLHAAGIYTAMSRLRIKDGTMFHSEASLFTAALVLGLYVFMMQPETDSQHGSDCATPETNSSQRVEPYEFLNDVDWSTLRGGRLGLGEPLLPSSSSPAVVEFPVPVGGDEPSRAARQFIRNGGPVSFSGFICAGGYQSAKMVLHEFASLLEGIGKWKAKRYCYILKIMSDTLLDIDDR
ncbi:hypothetical protein PFICI_04566 [Pestalotiopsis fici W106-1]|uniref:Transcription factor domain-containing protein n=1 Tax=Pestalotiopsis fici (strain W106-1 / CGMCC3.15140) TaxID=1229662 RepID=W3X9F0_PESFW|nr:uncharacterized protein PFICI_04566 [Pestalotiopsis fici W106-1]ETS82690.1 hypothetical protein PFICI_04566 [Pestalotiopsis fici W106-1]